MFERILVALDGSPEAANAIQPAAELAKKFGSTVFLVTVAHTIGEWTETAVPSVNRGALSQDTSARLAGETERAEERAYLHKVHDDLVGQGLKVETRVREGKPAEQINELAKEIGANVIVLTAYGAGGAHTRSGNAVFGGVADEVLRLTRAPVLLIRP